MDSELALKFATATLEDVEMNPAAFGAPTFAEFAANPDKYRGRTDELFSEMDQGSLMLLDVKRQEYEVRFDGGLRTYEAKSLEMAERILKDEGYALNQIVYKPDLRKIDAGKCSILIVIEPKEGVKPNVILPGDAK